MSILTLKSKEKNIFCPCKKWEDQRLQKAIRIICFPSLSLINCFPRERASSWLLSIISEAICDILQDNILCMKSLLIKFHFERDLLNLNFMG